MSTTVVLVRHAESVRPAFGRPDYDERPLTGQGERQAQQLVPELYALSPSAVYASPYLRAEQTVRPVAQMLGLSVQTRWDLREWDSGFLPAADWVAHYEESFADLTFARPGGESIEALCKRADAVLRALADLHPSEVVLVASHGTFISAALHGFGVPPGLSAWRDMPMPAVFHVTVPPSV